jgi:hypothetical protein
LEVPAHLTFVSVRAMLCQPEQSIARTDKSIKREVMTVPKPPSWQDRLIPAVAVGSPQHLHSRRLYIQKLDAQGLLCAACGFPLGEGTTVVGSPGNYRLRPCAACAAYRYERSRGKDPKSA